jgi:Zn-dependent peptidase ImmA (M78 family)
MAARSILLIPKTARWAREYRGVSDADAAKALGNSIERLHLLETQGGPITAGELQKLAKKYRLPEATLAMPEPPPVPPAPEDFRTLEGRDPTLSIKTREAISTAQERQLQLFELQEVLDETPREELARYASSDNASVAAHTERGLLKFTFARQRELSDAHDIFTDLRERVEQKSVSVYALQFPLNDCRGFSLLSTQIGPTVVISTKETEWSARNFTLMHEYAHLLLRRPGISDERGGNRIERWCNLFAAAFLMPEDIIAQLFDASISDPDYDTVRLRAASLGVSRQALALRLEELRLAPKGYYNRIVEGQASRKTLKKRKSSGNYVNTQLFSLGPRFQRYVARALDRQRIGAVDASRILQMAPRHFIGLKSFRP